MKRIVCKLWVRKLTPSGLWDNGLWVLSDREVSIPKNILEQAIVADTELKISKGYGGEKETERAFKVTAYDSTWVVDKNPLKIKA